MRVLQTDRLTLHWLTTDDAAFILALVNEPSWIQFIGDKDVQSLDDARNYIVKGPAAMYARHGFGLYLVELKHDRTPIGLCGLIKRDMLKDVDIGFAFLPAYWSRGYASEAAAATLEYGRQAFGLKRIVAITNLDNQRSIRLLEKIGMQFENDIHLSGNAEELKLFACELA
jgi:RimJ/RimL family protein N-acetyltransferase